MKRMRRLSTTVAIIVTIALLASCRTTKHTTNDTLHQSIKTEMIEKDSAQRTAIALRQKDVSLLTISEDFEVDGDCLIISTPQGHRIIGAKRIKSHRHAQQTRQAETTKQEATESHTQEVLHKEASKVKATHRETHKVQEASLPWYVWVMLIALASGWCWWVYRKS